MHESLPTSPPPLSPLLRPATVRLDSRCASPHASSAASATVCAASTFAPSVTLVFCSFLLAAGAANISAVAAFAVVIAAVAATAHAIDSPSKA